MQFEASSTLKKVLYTPAECILVGSKDGILYKEGILFILQRQASSTLKKGALLNEPIMHVCDSCRCAMIHVQHVAVAHAT